MAWDIEIALPMLTDFGLAAFLAIGSGHCSRIIQKRQVRANLVGGGFGLASAFSALYHPLISASTNPDNTAVFVGFAAAFLGPAGAFSAVSVSLFMGQILQSVEPWQVMQILIAGIAGLAWSVMSQDLDRRSTRALVALGTLISAALLPGSIWQLWSSGLQSNLAIAASFFVNMFVTVLIGTLIERERAMLEAELQMQHLANTDPLTGLYNRRTITTVFKSRVGTHAGHALVLIDVDHFKSVNDAHGHSAGDEVLRHIANRLQSSIRAGDLLSRVGGEEFVVLISAESAEEALAAGERLRADVERHRVRIGQLALQVTISVGVAWWNGKADFEEKLNLADLGLYRAKTAGRNRVRGALSSEEQTGI